jgi:antitoxin component of RelBE/YafQ-DinJ toxin-antitoxin module
MTVLFRCHIEKSVLEKANRVAERLGTSTSEMVRLLVTQMGCAGRIPLKLDTAPDDFIVGSWESRATTLKSFYDSSKTW